MSRGSGREMHRAGETHHRELLDTFRARGASRAPRFPARSGSLAGRGARTAGRETGRLSQQCGELPELARAGAVMSPTPVPWPPPFD
jgi:hypothetical protein